jgi:nucleotide-binding universal stress UspA family protein
MIIQRILLATDFSKSSSHALDYAVILAQKFSSEIILLHVVQPSPPLVTDLAYSGAELLGGSAAIIRQTHDRLGALIEEISHCGVHVTAQCREGLPYDELMALASEQSVDLIVLGTHGHTGLSHILLGSVAEKVVRHAVCPVLTVRHPDFIK